MKEFFNDIGNIPLLTQKEEIELAKKIQKGGVIGKQAEDKMVSANLRLVVSIAKNYTKKDVPLNDLVQEGNIGLIHAARKFEWEKGYRFSTYASWWIKQSITRFLDEKRTDIRIPVHMQQKITNYKKEVMYLKQKLGRTPTTAEIAKALGWDLEEIDKVQNANVNTTLVRLDDSCGGEDKDCTVADFIQDRKYESVEDQTCNKLMNYQLQKDMKTYLTQKEDLVIRKRFGFEGGSVQTLEEIGDYFGVTRERVRQIEVMAIKKLRRVYQKRGLELKDCI